MFPKALKIVVFPVRAGFALPAFGQATNQLAVHDGKSLSVIRQLGLLYDCPRTAEAQLATLTANCRARGSALSGVCLSVASQKP